MFDAVQLLPYSRTDWPNRSTVFVNAQKSSTQATVFLCNAAYCTTYFIIMQDIYTSHFDPTSGSLVSHCLIAAFSLFTDWFKVKYENSLAFVTDLLRQGSNHSWVTCSVSPCWSHSFLSPTTTYGWALLSLPLSSLFLRLVALSYHPRPHWSSPLHPLSLSPPSVSSISLMSRCGVLNSSMFIFSSTSIVWVGLKWSFTVLRMGCN